jgi:hypothetical protein
MAELTMEEMGDIFAAHHAGGEGDSSLKPLTREALAEALKDYVTNDYVLDEMFYAFEESWTPARQVTAEQAAERLMPEIVWDGKVLRFRKNTMVTTLLDHGPQAIRKHGFLHWRKGWELDQFKQLLENRDPIIKWLMLHGPADMNRLAVQSFSQESRERFAMLIGYSVSGAGNLSYFSDAMYNRARVVCDQMIAEKEAASGS